MDASDPESKVFFLSMNKIVELAGTPNVADFLPWLKYFDPSGVKKGIAKNMATTLKVTSRFVQERLEQRKRSDDHLRKKDFLDTLIEYEGDGKSVPNKISLHDAQILIMEMFFAGSETTSINIEWAFTEMMRHPHVLKRARDEIDEVVGLNRKVEESDFENLPYLQAIVKEGLRLHPSLPLGLPRMTNQDTEYMGYFVPKDTQVFVNLWGIGRDPNAWEDPLSFKPERFLGSDVQYKGQHFSLLPFGSGRRICVGFPLAERIVHFTLATIIQNFDWELPAGVTPKTIDMEENFGLTLRKKTPFKAVPKKRKDLKF
jgi:cytochrome P450